MIRRPPRSTLFPYRRSSDLLLIKSPQIFRFTVLVLLSLSLIDEPGCRVMVFASASNPLFWPLIIRSEEHTSELQSRRDLVCRLLLEKKKITLHIIYICEYII